MQAAKEVVDTEIGHEKRQEGEGHIEVIGQGTLEDWETLSMHHDGIDHEGNERPHFLGVPAPISAPRDVGPNSSDEDAEASGGEGGVEEDTAENGKRFNLRTATREMEDERRDAADEGEAKQGEGNHDDADVKGEQR